MKRLLITGLIVCIVLLGWLYGWRLTESSAIPGSVRVVSSHNTVYGKAVLFEDKVHDTFGGARLKQYLGILYQYDGGSFGNFIEEGKPFAATGFGNDDTEDSLLVVVKTAEDSNIKYIALGNHMEGLTASDTYSFTIEDVKEHIDKYHLAEVDNNYTLFVLDKYTEDAWTIRGFDDDGKLIADKLFGGEIRYIHW
ncbi:hypothetical protein J2T13_002923 [Paenibacillus sp. DS2015]|uniref:hypothetical protein n=1 Tax=Paenibacillus sp. DS2015 TaxID=3373917 RepID=UPI003D1F8B05